MNKGQQRTSLHPQLHPQHTMHSNMHYTHSSTLPTTFLNPPMHTTNKHKHSWQNGTRCRDGVNVLYCHSHGVNVLWCRSHLVGWFLRVPSLPACTCFHSVNFFCDLCNIRPVRWGGLGGSDNLAWRLTTLHGCSKRSGCGRVQVGPITFSQTKHEHELIQVEPSPKMAAHHCANLIDRKVPVTFQFLPPYPYCQMFPFPFNQLCQSQNTPMNLASQWMKKMPVPPLSTGAPRA